MKNLFLLVGLSLAPLTAYAQNGSYEAYKEQIRQGAAATEASRTHPASGGMANLPYKTKAERQLDRADRQSRRIRRADTKAHNNTESLPGGYRWDNKTNQIIRPDGTYAGAPEAQPARKAAPAAPRPIDPNNSLGKLQEYNRQEEARRKATAKPAQ